MQGYVQGALRKELLIALFIEHYQTTTLGNSYWYIFPVLGTIYLNIAFLLNFTDGTYVQGALQKELLIAPFVEHFKQLLWESLNDNVNHNF